MKRTIIMTLTLLVSVVLVANATTLDKGGKKKGKHQKEEPLVEQVANLTTVSDSISYAAGMAATRGLIPYLENTLGYDTLFAADFRHGFLDAIAHNGDPKYVAYNAGIQIASQVEKQIYPREAMVFADTPDSLSFDVFYRGFLDGVANDTTHFQVDAAAKYAEAEKKDATTRKAEAYKAENILWLEENKGKEGVITLPSGLQYRVITQGDGPIATENSDVTVRYEGKMIDGTVFDSSYERNPDTSKFKPTKVIKGWGEALQMMPQGSKWELFIPQELGYGERQAGKIRPNSTLIFTVEVVNVDTPEEKTED